jgi:hypothetical protein
VGGDEATPHRLLRRQLSVDVPLDVDKFALERG